MHTPAVFRFRRHRPFDHVAPGRRVILWSRLRAAFLRHWQRLRFVYLRPAWDAVMPWAAGFAFIAAFLLGQGWLARRDLELDLAEARAAASRGEFQAQALKDQMNQMRALGNCQTLFYLVEAKTQREVFKKLTQAATQLEAARTAEWSPAQ
ncbi:MAG: hypothetical protein IPM64_17730 [Phycisphaerales bacterium]|nr:hypothetical protein [Phycisphaerales bacterium]